MRNVFEFVAVSEIHELLTFTFQGGFIAENEEWRAIPSLVVSEELGVLEQTFLEEHHDVRQLRDDFEQLVPSEVALLCAELPEAIVA